MNAFGDPTRHFWLAQGVARALGVRFTEAMQRGRITPAEYAELVDRCCACPHGADCIDWLGRNGAKARTAPPFCRIAAALETLARQH